MQLTESLRNINHYHIQSRTNAKMSTIRYESGDEADVSRLAQPLAFEQSRKIASNRILKSSIAEALSSWDVNDLQARGIPTKEYVELYRR